MSRDIRKPAILCLSLISVLALTTTVTVRFMSAGKQTARSAAADLHACQQLAAEIKEFRRTGANNGQTAETRIDLATMIESAAQAADVTPDQILQVDPQPPVTIRNTRYQNNRTRIDLRGVTIEQIIRTLHVSISNEPTLSVERLALRPPAHSPVDNVWDADVVVARITLQQDNPNARQ